MAQKRFFSKAIAIQILSLNTHLYVRSEHWNKSLQKIYKYEVTLKSMHLSP